MKVLGLLRHAKSEWDDMAQRDFDRGLNERGRKGAVMMGDHLREHNVAWGQMLASPAVRVKQTLELALPEFEPQFDERLYLASSETIVETLQELDHEADNILIVGHNPGLQAVIFDLVSPARENALFKEAATKFPTASYAVIECDVDNWADLKKGCGILVHFARPRDLDPDLGPQH
jgi:phosphohistidine phosphatase